MNLAGPRPRCAADPLATVAWQSSRRSAALQVFVKALYVLHNRLRFLFISIERSGGSRILRLAIRNEVVHFTNEMAQGFRNLGRYKELTTRRLQMICGKIPRWHTIWRHPSALSPRDARLPTDCWLPCQTSMALIRRSVTPVEGYIPAKKPLPA